MSHGCTKLENSEEVDEPLTFEIDPGNEKQIIHNFGASDAWSCQFVGKNWPLEKRNEIANLLFSTEVDQNHNPEGIGLSLWRFNIGAGTAEQGESSDIQDEWRRAETFLNSDGSYDWSKQSGQQWFLEAARDRGVDQFVAFVNSPPIHYTKNGKGYSSSDNTANLKDENIDDFAGFMTDVLQHFKEQGISFNYISPVNEPQWNWDNPGQEGSSYRNEDIYKVVKELDESISEKGLETKIEIPEAGRITDLYQNDSLPERNHQIHDFFDPSSPYYLGDLPSIPKKVAAHSYFTTYPENQLRSFREQLYNSLIQVDPGLEFWMSEYCILEDNPLIKGGGRDLSMDPAIYLAKVIHYDLTLANASAWHWWIAISPYDYKDGLVYMDYNKNDGEVFESKMLWGMGNFSRFVRPGMRRIAVVNTSGSDSDKLLISSYQDEHQLVIVIVNTDYDSKTVNLDIRDFSERDFKTYVTSSGKDLEYSGELNIGNSLEISSRSIFTLVADR